MKIVIIGGGAGGIAAATRSRRLSEKAIIRIYEKFDFVSYSNCALPYIFSKEVEKFDDLILNSPQKLKDYYNIDVFTNHDVQEIDSQKKELKIFNKKLKKFILEKYDKLIIASGTIPIVPPIKGLAEAKNVFSLKNPNNVADIQNYIDSNKVKKITIIGAGFIGLEIAENFSKAGYDVSIIDMMPRILPMTLDEDISSHVYKEIKENGVKIYLNEKVEEITQMGRSIKLASKKEIFADLIFLTIGVKVPAEIYKKAGLKFGITNGIIVDNKQRTNINDIFAIGDVAETIDLDGNSVRIALATPALRQASVAANTIFDYKDSQNKSDTYKGSQGTNTITIFNRTIASIGKTEEQLQKLNIKYNKTINTRTNHVSAIKNSESILLKVLYDDNFKILGAQAIGPLTTEKRISYIALAMFANIPLNKLEDFQIAYSANTDTAFDVLNMAARIAKHQASGTLKSIGPNELEKLKLQGAILLDVRTNAEWKLGHIKESINIPLHKLRSQIHTLDLNKIYVLICHSGLRSYNATQILRNNNFKNIYNLAGGYFHYSVYYENLGSK